MCGCKQEKKVDVLQSPVLVARPQKEVQELSVESDVDKIFKDNIQRFLLDEILKKDVLCEDHVLIIGLDLLFPEQMVRFDGVYIAGQDGFLMSGRVAIPVVQRWFKMSPQLNVNIDRCVDWASCTVRYLKSLKAHQVLIMFHVQAL